MNTNNEINILLCICNFQKCQQNVFQRAPGDEMDAKQVSVKLTIEIN